MCSKEPGIIRKLDEVVINRIAAGEVVQRPANALKELLENSLDAGSCNVQVVVKGGGLKLLQIQDDGCGIRREDLAIVCERFTTSKLETFEDLQQIGTYGFRGEALASISHVAHLTIVTKTQNSPCAFRATYANGKLEDRDPGATNPKPCAGNQGTIIIVEDLFYNMETRRRALRTASEEYNKIVDVVTRYAIHNARAGFSLKKHGENNNDLRTPSNSTTLDNIKILYGVQIARELLPVTCDDSAAQFKMTGYISNANYSVKKPTFLLFINNRLVDSSALRKNIDGIYSAYLPKGSHPFIYLSLEIEPKNVDVNVHPTKHEVHFLHEDVITAAVGNSIDKILQGSNQSRTFFVQSLLPGASGISVSTGDLSRKRKDGLDVEQAGPSKGNDSPIVTSAKNMIRTDPREQKLDRFFTSTPNPNNSSSMLNKSGCDTPGKNGVAAPGSGSSRKSSTSSSRRETKLKSVRNLRDKIVADCHEVLLNVLRNHSFVGCVNRTHALIQHDTKLYMVNTVKLSAEMFYQKMMFQFGSFGSLTIDDRISLRELVHVALETDKSAEDNGGVNKDEFAQEISEFLLSKAPMLQDYFSLKFSADGELKSLPLLLDDYIPSMYGMPSYLLNLAKRVNWESEQECFETFCHETSLFYAVPPGDDKLNEEVSANERTWKWTIEHVIYPEIKKSILPPKSFADDSTIIQLADLPSLYKVFERC